MPAYKQVANLGQPLHENGFIYNDGDVIRERVVVTEKEAEIMNLRHPETKLILIDDPKLILKRPLNQMNLDELEEEGKKFGLEFDESQTRKIRLELIKLEQEKLK